MNDLLKIIQAADIIKKGGIAVFPTRCLYGLGVDPFNPKAVESLFAIKKRPADKPILILINEIKDLDKLAENIPETAVKLINCFWPGKITIVFNAKKEIPAALTAGTGKIGIRIPAHPAAAELVKKAGIAVTGTSANVSGCPGCRDIKELDTEIADNADIIIDSGRLMEGAGSTVIDVTVEPPAVLREGAVLKNELQKILHSIL